MARRNYYDQLMIDKLTLLCGVIGPLSTLPQLWNLYIGHNGAGVSAATWFLASLTSIPLLFYGLHRKLKVIVMQQVLWVALQLLIAIGAVMYG